MKGKEKEEIGRGTSLILQERACPEEKGRGKDARKELLTFIGRRKGGKRRKKRFW